MRRSIYLLIVFTLLVSGCSSEALDKAEAEAEDQIAFEDCKEAFSPLLKSLDAVNSDLTVGVSVADYGTVVREANRTYGDVMSSGELGDVQCLERVGVPAERAINYHVKAFNIWNDCVSELCDDATIEDRRQRLWARAANSTNRATDNLAKLSPNAVE
jgi:hypothetical protein